jgi:hypothetical protein
MIRERYLDIIMTDYPFLLLLGYLAMGMDGIGRFNRYGSPVGRHSAIADGIVKRRH